MRPNTAYRNSELNPNTFSMSNSKPSNLREVDSVVHASLDLSTMLSTPIFVDMSTSLYDKINSDAWALTNQEGTAENKSDFCTSSSTESGTLQQSQIPTQNPTSPQETESLHQQPVRRSTMNSNMEQVCRSRSQDESRYQEPPVLARIPVLPNVRESVQSNRSQFNASFEELMAQTVSGLEQMRASASQAKTPDFSEQEVNRTTVERSIVQAEENYAVKSSSSEPTSTLEKREKFLSTINWGSFRRLFFNREAIKLGLITITVFSLVIAGFINKNSRMSHEQGLSEDVAVSLPAALTETTESAKSEAVTIIPSPQKEQVALTPVVPMEENQMDDNLCQNQTEAGLVHNPDFNGNELGNQDMQQAQNISVGNGNIIPPSRNEVATLSGTSQSYTDPNAGFDAMPQYNSAPEYAPVTPAVGNQYSPSDYESPVLEEEPVDYAGSGIPNNSMR